MVTVIAILNNAGPECVLKCFTKIRKALAVM